jgi:hypothetical protein
MHHASHLSNNTHLLPIPPSLVLFQNQLKHGPKRESAIRPGRSPNQNPAHLVRYKRNDLFKQKPQPQRLAISFFFRFRHESTCGMRSDPQEMRRRSLVPTHEPLRLERFPKTIEWVGIECPSYSTVSIGVRRFYEKGSRARQSRA